MPYPFYFKKWRKKTLYVLALLLLLHLDTFYYTFYIVKYLLETHNGPIMVRSHQIICSRPSDRTAKNWVRHPLLPTVWSQSDRTVGSKFIKTLFGVNEALDFHLNLISLAGLTIEPMQSCRRNLSSLYNLGKSPIVVCFIKTLFSMMMMMMMMRMMMMMVMMISIKRCNCCLCIDVDWKTLFIHSVYLSLHSLVGP